MQQFDTKIPRAGPEPWWRGAVIYQVYPRSFADTERRRRRRPRPGSPQHLDHIASLGVDAVWLSPFFTSPMKDFGYDVADYRDVDPIFGTLGRLRRADRPRARAGPEGHHRPGLSPTPRTSTPGSARAGRAGPTPRPTGTSGPTPSPTARRPPTGSRCSAAPPGPGTRGAASTTCTTSCREQPQLNVHNRPRCRTRCWTPRASGSTAASTASASTPSTSRCTTRS